MTSPTKPIEARIEASGIYRIVVCMDIEGESLYEAYGKLNEALNDLSDREPDIAWESSDEWFDTDGEPGSSESLSVVRCNYIYHKEGYQGPEK
jgi:hypothetical protein